MPFSALDGQQEGQKVDFLRLLSTKNKVTFSYLLSTSSFCSQICHYQSRNRRSYLHTGSEYSLYNVSNTWNQSGKWTNHDKRLL